MAFLDTMAKELLGPKSVGELSKTGEASSEQTKQLVTAALPLLMSKMQQNAGTEAGAQSLAKALAQHAPDAQSSTSAMLKKADAADGKKIVSHILGKDEKAATKELSRATGLSNDQVGSMLGQLAPVVLSLVGNQTQQQPQQAQSPSGLAGLLGSALLGGGSQQSGGGLNVAGLAGSLLSGGSGGSLLSGLLGGGTTAQEEKPASTTKPRKPKTSSTSTTSKPKTGSSTTASKPKTGSTSTASKPKTGTSSTTSKPKTGSTSTTSKPKTGSTSKPKKKEEAKEEKEQGGGLNLGSMLMGLLK